MNTAGIQNKKLVKKLSPPHNNDLSKQDLDSIFKKLPSKGTNNLGASEETSEMMEIQEKLWMLLDLSYRRSDQMRSKFNSLVKI